MVKYNYKVKGFSFKKVGKKYIEVSYGGKKAYFTVTVKANKVSSLIISSLPKKTTYKVGQSINKKDWLFMQDIITVQ